MMIGCRWSATRGVMMLVGLFAMVMLVGGTRVSEPPLLTPWRSYHTELLRDPSPGARMSQPVGQPDLSQLRKEQSKQLAQEARMSLAPEQQARLRELVNAAAIAARQETDPKQMELSAILDDFHDAASKADFDRYFRHWSPVSVFLGTDATERWVGQEFRDYAQKRFDTGKGWTYRPHDRHITMAPDGEHGFFDELVTNEKYGTCRGSGVFRKMEGQWWIMQYNLSIPVPNELAERVVGIIKLGAPKAPAGEGKHQE